MCDLIVFDLILVWGEHLAFDAQDGLGRVGVRHDGQHAALEAMVARAVVGHLDVARLAGSDRLAGIVAYGAATTRAYTTDDQRCIARIGEMEGIGHHFALEQRPEIMFFLVESDGGLLAGRLRG